jgi:signal transduction histidine kinase
VEVEDRGPGVKEADIPRIFEEFVQLGTSEESGTGLGLPISRRLAELLGGRLTARSKVGSGSTFRLELPRDLPEGAGQPSSPPTIPYIAHIAE